VDAPLLAAASGFAAATGYGARVAVREHVPGEPFGVRAPGQVATHLLLGWGAGISAPWPMPVTAVALALRGRAGAGTGCLAIGAAFLLGQLVEPVTWGRRPSSPAITRSMALNLASGAALVLAGVSARCPTPRRPSCHRRARCGRRCPAAA
jgi:hypothetical protein